mmetsp:Transcript_15240/g.42976  ORF Transcript_15240/g.42976 Transcript_15240/m.42976 type:complete len:227 (+) Transcript_15240:1415-2095(+)
MMMAVVAVLFHVGGVCALAGVEDALPALVQDAGEVEGAVHLALRGVHVVPVQRVRGIVVGVDEADDVGDLVGAPEDEVGAREGQIGLADDAQQHPEGEDERNQARDLQDAREEPAAPLEPAASSPASLLFALSIAATEVLPVAAAAAAAAVVHVVSIHTGLAALSTPPRLRSVMVIMMVIMMIRSMLRRRRRAAGAEGRSALHLLAVVLVGVMVMAEVGAEAILLG